MSYRKERSGGTQKGFLIISVLVLLLIVSVLAFLSIQGYATSAFLTRMTDRSRQEFVQRAVVCELLREALYANETAGMLSLQERITTSMQTYWGQNVSVRVLGNHYMPANFPLVSGVVSYHEISLSDRESLPLSIARWAGADGVIYQGETLYVEVEGPMFMRFAVRPVYIPLSCLPFVSYDLNWSEYQSLSAPLYSRYFRFPTAWRGIDGHGWMDQVPSRLRDLLMLRLGLFRRLLDPLYIDEWLRRFSGDAIRLDFHEQESLSSMDIQAGVHAGENQVEIDLSLFSGKSLLVQGSGTVRFTGYRYGNPLVVVVVSGETGDVNVEIAGSPAGMVGPLALYGINAWRSQSASSLRVTSSDGSGIHGACLFWPGVQWEVPIYGHVSFHAAPEYGYTAGYEPAVIPMSGMEMRELGMWMPVFTLWDIREEME